MCGEFKWIHCVPPSASKDKYKFLTQQKRHANAKLPHVYFCSDLHAAIASVLLMFFQIYKRVMCTYDAMWIELIYHKLSINFLSINIYISFLLELNLVTWYHQEDIAHYNIMQLQTRASYKMLLQSGRRNPSVKYMLYLLSLVQRQ